MKKITILIPCYNEEESLPLLYERLSNLISKIEKYNIEILFINDGSSDKSLSIIKDLSINNQNISYIDLSRNFGKEIAMIAGMDHVDSDAAIIMDADLQHPPELILEMIYWWEQGYDDVCAKRKNRVGESWLKKTITNIYYKMLQKFSRTPIQPNVGDFRLLNKKCIEALKQMRESQRYTKGLFSWIGFNKKEIYFDNDVRAAGTTKWNYFSLIGFAIEGFTSFTTAPLKLASVVGIIMSILSILYMTLIIIKTIIYGDAVAGYPSLISIILFIGGVQLFFMGIIGEYLGRIFNETKQRPLYFIKEYKPINKEPDNNEN